MKKIFKKLVFLCFALTLSANAFANVSVADSIPYDTLQIPPSDAVGFVRMSSGVMFYWTPIAGTDRYSIHIVGDGYINMKFVFDYAGRFIDSLSYRAPARNRVLVSDAGQFSYLIEGLPDDQVFDYTFTAFDSEGEVIETIENSFSTAEATALPALSVKKEILKEEYFGIDGKRANNNSPLRIKRRIYTDGTVETIKELR